MHFCEGREKPDDVQRIVELNQLLLLWEPVFLFHGWKNFRFCSRIVYSDQGPVMKKIIQTISNIPEIICRAKIAQRVKSLVKEKKRNCGCIRLRVVSYKFFGFSSAYVGHQALT